MHHRHQNLLRGEDETKAMAAWLRQAQHISIARIVRRPPSNRPTGAKSAEGGKPGFATRMLNHGWPR